MTPRVRLVFAVVGCLTAVAPSAKAAPTLVDDWKGGLSFPADVSMYVHRPAQLAPKPPIVAVIHYCGGTAQAVFGQAQGGGLVAAADEHGFILVLPSSGRCWDVTSAKAHTRDGGGDMHAIAQMVKHALTKYGGNPERVYSTGISSGGMTTQLLLALYPDLFKGGSAFAGVPAGCMNAFDGMGRCGLPTQTAQQWGDRVRAMAPSYTGKRPRVQLFHGDKDATIHYQNFLESIKEWTNVLGLPEEPTMTDMNVPLGKHMAKRQRWTNQCGAVVLDAFTSQFGSSMEDGTDAHGPSDALFEADYVVPFLGLDDTGEVDPVVEQCGQGGGGAGGSGGTPNGGGAGGAAGTSSVAGAANGGASGTSGGSGGSSGGAGGSAGTPHGGGGAPASAGSGGAPAAGAPASPTAAEDGAGCGCRLGAENPSPHALFTTAALGLAFAWRRRRRTCVSS